ncbi:L-rhamnose 1-epimerase [bacterium M21]|nr:L-rhamnose 1-epimerase [bacterium M21]
MALQRHGSVIELAPEKIDEYKELHAAVWPDVLKLIKEANIQNYSIYLREIVVGQFFLFSYFEYVGSDFEGDMATMAGDPTTKRWWDCCMPCQKVIETSKEGEWWSGMEEVFHLD